MRQSVLRTNYFACVHPTPRRRTQHRHFTTSSTDTARACDNETHPSRGSTDHMLANFISLHCTSLKLKGGSICLDRSRSRRLEVGPADGGLCVARCRTVDAGRRLEGDHRRARIDARNREQGRVPRRQIHRGPCRGVTAREMLGKQFSMQSCRSAKSTVLLSTVLVSLPPRTKWYPALTMLLRPVLFCVGCGRRCFGVLFRPHVPPALLVGLVAWHLVGSAESLETLYRYAALSKMLG